MSISIVVLIVGAVFLAIGLIGGGIKFGVKEGEASIPTLNPMARVLSFIIGISFIAFGLWRDANPPTTTVSLTTEPTSSLSIPTQDTPVLSNPTSTIAPVQIDTPEISTPVSMRICGDNEGAFKDGLNTSDPLFWRSEGFVSGWLSSDPATIELPNGTSQNLNTQFVLVVQDLPWVQVRNVMTSNGKANSWGCWYTTSEFVEQDARQDLCVKKQGGSFAKFYQVDAEGIKEIGTTQTISCP